MTKELSVRAFCNDTRVQSVLFFKKDGSIQAASCCCQEEKGEYQEKCQNEDTVVLEDVALIARSMLGGVIDYPYASGDVISQEVNTTVEVTTGSYGAQDPSFKWEKTRVSFDECNKEPPVAANGQHQVNFPNGSWRVRRRYYLPEGPEVCEIESFTVMP